MVFVSGGALSSLAKSMEKPEAEGCGRWAIRRRRGIKAVSCRLSPPIRSIRQSRVSLGGVEVGRWRNRTESRETFPSRNKNLCWSSVCKQPWHWEWDGRLISRDSWRQRTRTSREIATSTKPECGARMILTALDVVASSPWMRSSAPTTTTSWFRNKLTREPVAALHCACTHANHKTLLLGHAVAAKLPSAPNLLPLGAHHRSSAIMQ
ncbi:hypothetical protein K402DRAFT_36008 [Aulographum hederae CBS 113979]|uniref:Uncharacterized protein n=1 Tax=Aulographum hederae CBS 113979 TaxID=1176131 RepID=A0A6G1H3T8_9PEZI|nr:hypothetical protein K402DRAFT_36008 [Aulographum hederae CBS 113979]